MKYSKVLAALAFSAIISAESVALEPVRHTVFSTDITNLGTYTQVGAVVNIKVSIFESVNSANKVYEETHTVTVNNFGFLQFEIGSGVAVSGSFGGGLTPSLIVKTYVVDGETERIIDTKRMSEIIYNANVSRYSHTVGLNPDPALTGASVISQIQIDENGVLTTTNRDLTPADIGAASTTQLTDGLALKVDKETGKSLMTDAERTKLAGIAEGAEVNVNADWNATTGDAQILNKPTTLAGYGITDAASATQLADGLALKVDKETGKSLMTDAERTKLAGIEEGATNYQHPLTHPATMIVEDETHRFVTDTEKATWSGKLDNSLNRGYVFIGDAQNKPVATLGGEGEVLMSNGVYNNFGKVKDANIANDAAIAGTKITPDFGPNSEITGGELNVGQINVLAEAPYQGTIYTEGTITSDGGFDGTSLTVTGSVLAGDISSDGDVDVVGNVTAGGDLAATGDITAENITANATIAAVDGAFTGDVLASSLNADTNIDAGGDISAGGNITATGDITAENITANATIAAVDGAFTGDVLASSLNADTNIDAGGDISAGGTISAAAFSGPLTGNATTATNLENATADNTVYLGNTAGNAWGKITNDHIDAAAGIAQSKVDGLTADLAAKANAADLTAHTSNLANPHAVTKAQVGLGDVDNTSDLAKPISTATQTALNLKANLAGATFTGAVKGIAPSDNSDLTTKLYVDTEVANATLNAGNGIDIDNVTNVISAKLDGTTLSNGAAGLKLNLANANTWTAAQTVEAKVTANEFSTATGRLVTGETLGTAWANVNKGANAVLEMGLGLAANGTDREGYGITINDDDANHRAVLGKTQYGWSAGVQGTTAAAGAVTSGAADAKLVVMNGLVEKFSADQDGLVKATTFQGALDGNANTATTASSASLLAATEAAGNSAVTAINLSTDGLAKISGAKVDPVFGNASTISGGTLSLTGKATSAATVDADADATLTTKGYVDEIDEALADITQDVVDELDATQTGAGLEATGTYLADATTNYLTTASSLKDADKKLDAQAKVNADAIAAEKTRAEGIEGGLQTELNTTQTGAGLAADGTYTADATTEYLDAATSLMNADKLLDAQAKVNADAIATEKTRAEGIEGGLQTELNTTQTGAGLAADGTYTADNTTEYLDAATSLMNADKLLDAQVKVNADAIATKLANRFAANNVWIGNGVGADATAGLIANANIADAANITATKLGTGVVDNTEFNVLDGATAGTVVASKAVVVDANKNISGFRSVGIDLGADAFTALTINTTAANAKAAQLNGSVGITTAAGDDNGPTLTVKSEGDSRGIEAVTDGTGIAGYFYNAGSADHKSPTVYAQSESDGSGAGGEAWGMGAALYVTNETQASTSTAIYVYEGRTILSYADIDAAATLDLSGLGYASVISVNDVAVAATEITFPTNPENGQVLYIVNNSGLAIDCVNNDHDIAINQTATFIYAGGWRRVK